MPISDKLIDQLLEDNNTLESLLGEDGLLKQLTKRIAERALEADMDHHLGYRKHEQARRNTGNSRNGKSQKTVRCIHGEMDLDVPRDRNREFEPQLVRKGEKHLNGFDELIISLYAHDQGSGARRYWCSRQGRCTTGRNVWLYRPPAYHDLRSRPVLHGILTLPALPAECV